MKNKKQLFSAAVLLLALAIVGYLWHSGRDRYTIQEMDIQSPSHFDLLFHRHGGVTYRHHGKGVHMYLAQYRRDERVLHERVVRIASTDAFSFSGSAVWGVTIEEGMPRELRAQMTMGAAMGHGYFDFSSLDFDFATAITSRFHVNDQPIEVGK